MCFFFIGDCHVAWLNKKQNSISLSIAEDEYIVVGSYCMQFLWMKQMLNDYGIKQGTMNIHCDNSSVINTSKNLVLHSHTKHIEIYHQFIRDLVDEKCHFSKVYPHLTSIYRYYYKPLDSLRFEYLRKSQSICLID